MKRFALLFVIALFAFDSYAQMSLKELVDKVDWESSEAKFVYDFYFFVEPSKHIEWDKENSESNFKLKNIFLGDTEVLNSHIRVSIRTKKLNRINLIMLDECHDAKKAESLIHILYKEFGEPNKKEEEKSSYSNVVTTQLYWKTYKYSVAVYYSKSPTMGQNIVINLEPPI